VSIFFVSLTRRVNGRWAYYSKSGITSKFSQRLPDGLRLGFAFKCITRDYNVSERTIQRTLESARENTTKLIPSSRLLSIRRFIMHGALSCRASALNQATSSHTDAPHDRITRNPLHFILLLGVCAHELNERGEASGLRRFRSSANRRQWLQQTQFVYTKLTSVHRSLRIRT
jgi:hypothetical protein